MGTTIGFIDRSTTITTGGTSQELVDYAFDRRYLFIANPHDTLKLWVRIGASAAAANGSGSIPIYPGGSLTFKEWITPDKIQIIGSTTSQPVTCYEI